MGRDPIEYTIRARLKETSDGHFVVSVVATPTEAAIERATITETFKATSRREALQDARASVRKLSARLKAEGNRVSVVDVE
jgi:hypothetical protein